MTSIEYECSGFQLAVIGCHDDCGRGGRAVDSDNGQLHETLEGTREDTEVNDLNRRLVWQDNAHPLSSRLEKAIVDAFTPTTQSNPDLISRHALRHLLSCF